MYEATSRMEWDRFIFHGSGVFLQCKCAMFDAKTSILYPGDDQDLPHMHLYKFDQSDVFFFHFHVCTCVFHQQIPSFVAWLYMAPLLGGCILESHIKGAWLSLSGNHDRLKSFGTHMISALPVYIDIGLFGKIYRTPKVAVKNTGFPCFSFEA